VIELLVGVLAAQVDDGGWLSNNLGSILLAFAAFGAAALAAYVSVHNQGKQLQHDRELQNREQTRDSIDAAVGAVSDAVIAIHTYATSRSNAPNPVGEPQRAELTAERSNAWSAINGMRATNVRLELRFGRKHEIVTTHAATRAAIEALWNDPKTSKSEEVDEKADAVGNAFLAFRAACHKWFSA
jgi:hypothetical protein